MIKLTEDCQAPRILSLGGNTQDVDLCPSSACRGRGAVGSFSGSRNRRASGAIWWQRGELLLRAAPTTPRAVSGWLWSPGGIQPGWAEWEMDTYGGTPDWLLEEAARWGLRSMGSRFHWDFHLTSVVWTWASLSEPAKWASDKSCFPGWKSSKGACLSQASTAGNLRCEYLRR